MFISRQSCPGSWIFSGLWRPELGDWCDYTGTLIVVPDVCSLNLPGAQAESSNRHEGEQGEGVKGLKMVFVVLTRSGHYTQVNEIRLGSKPH